MPPSRPPPCPLQDGEHAYIRLNFNFGGSYEPGAKHPAAIFLKELSFRSADVRHAAKVVQEIKALRSSVQQREKERAERATLVQQEKLVRGKVRPAGGGDWVGGGWGVTMAAGVPGLPPAAQLAGCLAAPA